MYFTHLNLDEFYSKLRVNKPKIEAAGYFLLVLLPYEVINRAKWPTP